MPRNITRMPDGSYVLTQGDRELTVAAGEDLAAAAAGFFEDEAGPVPEVISPVQGRITLRAAGLRDQVEALIAQDPNAKDWWEYATAWRRDHPMIAMLAGALGLSDEAVDDLFRQAATIAG
jgi:hypothetical protein